MVVRVGIIGVGFMGRMHLASYFKLPDAKVVAFADTDTINTLVDILNNPTGYTPESIKAIYDYLYQLSLRTGINFWGAGGGL